MWIYHFRRAKGKLYDKICAAAVILDLNGVIPFFRIVELHSFGGETAISSNWIQRHLLKTSCISGQPLTLLSRPKKRLNSKG